MRMLRFATAAVTALMSLMNLPIAFDHGGLPAPVAWLATLVGVAGLGAAVALLRGVAWAPWAVLAVGLVNLGGAALAAALDNEGAAIGGVISLVIVVLGAACLRARPAAA
jgi:hypothetical protein